MRLNSEFLERNLAWLRQKYPEYVGVLSLVPEANSYSFEKTGEAITCRDAAGNWLHGPEDPLRSAQSDAERLVASSPELFVLIRPGLGYTALSLADAIEKRAPGGILLVVEDRLDLWKHALGLVDWSRALQSSCSVLLLGRPEIVVEAFLDRHPQLFLLPITVIASPGTGNADELDALTKKLSALSERHKARAEEELAALDVHLTVRRNRRLAPRVLVAVEALGYLAHAIADGFRGCGCDVELQEADKHARHNIRAHERFWQTAAIAPDLILWANRPEISPFASRVWRELGVANALWTMDSPPRLSLGKRDLGSMDLHVCFDPTYLPACGPLGARRAEQLSLGAGIRPLTDCGPLDGTWPERLGPDVAFVGSLGDARVGELRSVLWSEKREYAAFLDAIAKQPGDPAAAYEQETRRPYEGMPCFYVDEVRSAIRRIEVMSRMPRSALKIFGAADWVGDGSSFASCYGGPVRYGPDLAHIYYHARVNLNVFHAQCRDSTNSRVYDVLAAGGFLLSEDRPVLHREFEVGRHLDTFSTPEEAAEKVAHYLEHRAEREAIAREGKRHVLAHHTFPIRARRLLELARPFMGHS